LSDGSDFVDLGFPEVQQSQKISVNEWSVKKPKLSKGHMVIDSSLGACVEVQSLNVKKGVVNSKGKQVYEKTSRTIEGNKSSDGVVEVCVEVQSLNIKKGMGNSKGKQVSEKAQRTIEGSNSSDGVVEDS